MMAGGFTVTEENLADVLAELRQLQAAVLRHYAPEHAQHDYITRRLVLLIETLESLAGQSFEVYLG